LSFFAAFEIGADPPADPPAGLAPLAEIEDEAGIANRLPAEARGGGPAALQIRFNASKQLHL
jgi:hypothetical protein